MNTLIHQRQKFKCTIDCAQREVNNFRKYSKVGVSHLCKCEIFCHLCFFSPSLSAGGSFRVKTLQ